MYKFQGNRPTVHNVNRDRRNRFQHPKGVPDAELIFGGSRKNRWRGNFHHLNEGESWRSGKCLFSTWFKEDWSGIEKKNLFNQTTGRGELTLGRKPSLKTNKQTKNSLTQKKKLVSSSNGHRICPASGLPLCYSASRK